MRVNLTCHICGHKSVLSSVTAPCPICSLVDPCAAGTCDHDDGPTEAEIDAAADIANPTF